MALSNSKFNKQKNVVSIKSKTTEHRKILWADWAKMSKRTRDLGQSYDEILPKIIETIKRDLDDHKISAHTASIIFEKLTSCMHKLEHDKQSAYKDLMAQGGPLLPTEIAPTAIENTNQRDFQKACEKTLVELARLKVQEANEETTPQAE